MPRTRLSQNTHNPDSCSRGGHGRYKGYCGVNYEKSPNNRRHHPPPLNNKEPTTYGQQNRVQDGLGIGRHCDCSARIYQLQGAADSQLPSDTAKKPPLCTAEQSIANHLGLGMYPE